MEDALLFILFKKESKTSAMDAPPAISVFMTNASNGEAS